MDYRNLRSWEPASESLRPSAPLSLIGRLPSHCKAHTVFVLWPVTAFFFFFLVTVWQVQVQWLQTMKHLEGKDTM